jgi:23S rRNA (guanosine2251-2'-O)-methyltransferase
MSRDNENVYIYGRNPIEEILGNEPDRVSKIFVRNSLHDDQIPHIMNKASAYKIPISHVPGAKLFELVGKANDQGIVALISPVEYQSLGEWLDKIDVNSYPAVLLLDGIEDPHNMGAILRSAAAADINGVLMPKHRQVSVSAAVYKSSAGAAGKVSIVRAGNLNQAILKLKDAGFWIAGVDQQAEQVLWDLAIDRPLAFVIGSEDAGIRPKTLAHCDFSFFIPMANHVESLNASVSAALVSYEWRRKRKL